MNLETQRNFVRGVLRFTDHTRIVKGVYVKRPQVVAVMANPDNDRNLAMRGVAWLAALTGSALDRFASGRSGFAGSVEISPATFYNDRLVVIWGDSGQLVGRRFKHNPDDVPGLVELANVNLHVGRNELLRGMLSGALEEDLRRCWDFLGSEEGGAMWFSLGSVLGNQVMAQAASCMGVKPVDGETDFSKLPPDLPVLHTHNKALPENIRSEMAAGRKVFIFGHLPLKRQKDFRHFARSTNSGSSSSSSGEEGERATP